MILEIFTDGGSKGNPGPSAIGLVIYKDKKEVLRYREDIGIATNNFAEYTALVRALSKSKEYLKDVSHVICYADSQLVVRQLCGQYKIKNEQIMNFFFEIKGLEKEIGLPIKYEHIPREKNTLADALVNNKA